MRNFKSFSQIIFKYSKDQSLLSNIQKCRSMDQVFKIYSEFKEFMIPRVLSLSCRKLAHYSNLANIRSIKQSTQQNYEQFYLSVLSMETYYLSPSESLNIIYFLRNSLRYVEYCSIDQQKTISFADVMFDQLLKNVKYLSFNDLCNVYQELDKWKFYNLARIEDEKKILNKILDKLPSITDQKLLDSVFHVFLTYTKMVKLPAKERNGKLFILLSEKIEKISQYLYLKEKLKIININVAHYKENMKDDEEKNITNSIIYTFIEELYREFQSNQMVQSLISQFTKKFSQANRLSNQEKLSLEEQIHLVTILDQSLVLLATITNSVYKQRQQTDQRFDLDLEK